MGDTDHPLRPVFLLQESDCEVLRSVFPALQWKPERSVSFLPDYANKPDGHKDHATAHHSMRPLPPYGIWQ